MASYGAADRLQEHLLLCIVAFLFPLAGIIGGVYGLTRPDIA